MAAFMAETSAILFTVGDVIRKLRKERHWSIRKLEEQSGVGRMTISSIERNITNYHHNTLAALAVPFQKTASEIEAMAAPVRPSAEQQQLPPEWLSFTRRALGLSRLGQATLQMMLLALEDAGAVRRTESTPEATSATP